MMENLTEISMSALLATYADIIERRVPQLSANLQAIRAEAERRDAELASLRQQLAEVQSERDAFRQAGRWEPVEDDVLPCQDMAGDKMIVSGSEFFVYNGSDVSASINLADDYRLCRRRSQ